MLKNFPPLPPIVQLPIIGYVHSPLSQKFGVPRQPNLVNIPAMIEFIPPFDTPAAFEGLVNFSHIWLIWQFHHNTPQASFRPQVRPPRLGGNDKIGVFATRSMYRPANLGLSVVKLDTLQNNNGKIRLYISGADMVDGTPILDIKPYIAYSDSVATAKSGFAQALPVQKMVIFSPVFERAFQQYLANHLIDLPAIDNSLSNADLTLYQPYLTLQDFAIIQNLIAQDPRPAYRQAEIDTVFTMRYKGFDVRFSMDKNGVLVVDSIVAIE